MGLDENERKIWWDIAVKCWAQDPLARPSMDSVAVMLSNLRNTLTERTKGILHLLLYY